MRERTVCSELRCGTTPARSAMRALRACAMLALGATLAVNLGGLAPEPDPVPRRWQLDLETSDLQMVTLEVEDEPRSFLFLTYEVTNNSGEDLLFAPSWELATDEGQIEPSGRNVPLEVTAEIMGMLENPLLKNQVEIIDTLLQGPENAQEGLVIWPVEDYDPDEIVIYAAGFSGETESVIRPDTGEREVLRKVYMLRHHIGGTLEGRELEPLEPIEARWIMR